MRLSFILLIGVFAAGCNSQPVKREIVVNPIEESELGYIETKKIDKFLVKNAQQLRQFNKVNLFATQFDQLQLAEESDIELVRSWNDSSWKEMDTICQQLDDFSQKIFREGGEFVPVQRGGEDVLAIQFTLVSFMPYSQRYKDAGMDTVGAQTNNTGIGLVTVRGILANAKSGELVAVLEDTLEVNSRNVFMRNLEGFNDSNSMVAQNLAWRTAFRLFLGNLHDELINLKYAQIAQQP